MSPAHPRELLADTSFVSHLSRDLLTGAEDLGDVAQETWLSALTAVPAPRNLQAWLAKVARNHALQVRRASLRRASREHAAARAEAVPSAAEVVEREEVRRQIVGAVLDLREPYRSAVLLRFYEGLPPRRIAKILQVPVETVRSRIKRGLAELRGELDREHGSREQWALALLPLAYPAHAPVTTAARPVRQGALVGGVLAASVVVLWTARPFQRTEDVGGIAFAPDRGVLDASPTLPPAERPLSAQPAAATVPSTLDEVRVAATPGRTLRGRVVDRTGQPVPRAKVLAAEGPWIELSDGAPLAAAARATTDAAGAFELADLPDACLVGAYTDDSFTDCLKFFPDAGEVAEVDLILRPGRPVLGRTVTPAGEALGGAEVRVRTQGVEGRSTSAGQGGVSLQQGFAVRARSSQDGRFALTIPDGLRARIEGWTDAALSYEVVNLARGAAGEWRIVLDPAHRPELHIEGLAPDARPWIEVWAPGPGWRKFQADASDRATLPPVTEGVQAFVRVRAEGRQVLHVAPWSVSAGTDPPPVVFGQGEALAGRVVDGLGRPVPGASVAAQAWFAEGDPWREVDRRDFPAARVVAGTRTDDDGHFRLFPLDARPFLVSVLPPDRIDGEVSVVARPGDDVEVVVGDVVQDPAVLRLRVEGPDGMPLRSFQYQLQQDTGPGLSQVVELGARERTVEVEPVVASPARLVVTAEGLAPRVMDLALVPGRQEIPLRLVRPVDLHLRFHHPDGAGLERAWVACRDAQGEPVLVGIDMESRQELSPLRPNGELHLPGVPDEPLHLVLSEPLHTTPFEVDVDPREVPTAGFLEIEVPWARVPETGPAGLCVRFSDVPGLRELSRGELRDIEDDPLPDGTHATLVLSDLAGREFAHLEWRREEGEWRRDQPSDRWRGVVRGNGLLLRRRKEGQLPYAWWTEGRSRRWSQTFLQFDLPRAPTRFELTVDGWPPVSATLDRTVEGRRFFAAVADIATR